MRKVIVSGPVRGPLTEDYKSAGAGAARPTSSAHMNAAGGGGHLKGTKSPGTHMERGR